MTEWCDAVVFATRKFRTQTEDAGFGRKRTTAHAIGKDGGERILRTVGGPSCVAKNRYNLDAELPLEWNALLVGITGAANQQRSPNTFIIDQGAQRMANLHGFQCQRRGTDHRFRPDPRRQVRGGDHRTAKSS